MLLQDSGEQRAVLPGPLTIDAVVRAHYRRDASIHHCLEMRQVDLMQGARVDRHVDPEPPVFHRVQRIVLHAGHDVPLHAAGEGGAKRAEVARVLAVGFLRPAPGRMSQQVDADSAEKVTPECAQFPADHVADPFLQRRVPRRAPCHRDREGGGAFHDDTPRPIHETHARNAEPRHRPRHPGPAAVTAWRHHLGEPRPERRVAVHQAELLVEGELRQQGASASVDLHGGQDGSGFQRTKRGAGGGRRRGGHDSMRGKAKG